MHGAPSVFAQKHGDNTAVPSCAPLNNSPPCPQFQHRQGAQRLSGIVFNLLFLLYLMQFNRLGTNIDMLVSIS
jgi:hypothetical protein